MRWTVLALVVLAVVACSGAQARPAQPVDKVEMVVASPAESSIQVEKATPKAQAEPTAEAVSPPIVKMAKPEEVKVAVTVAADSRLKLEVYRYFRADQPPIPLGEVVKFVDDGGRLAIEWDQRVGAGHVLRHMVFEGIEVRFEAYLRPNSSASESRQPRRGDVGVVRYYFDIMNNRGEFGPDGIVDSMSVFQYRSWTPEELELLQLAGEFQREAQDKGFIVVRYVADCSPTEYRINGKKAEPGPYGLTYRVPPEGGVLSAWYESYCGDSGSGPYTRWEVPAVKPGDRFSGGENVYKEDTASIAETDPWAFCGFLEWIRPQWQPERYVSTEVAKRCDVYSVHDGRARARLARLGFVDLARWGDPAPKGVKPFVWWGEKQVKLDMPAYRWERVDQMGHYTVTTGYDEWYKNSYPAIRLPDKDRPIRWVNYGSLILLVSEETVGGWTFNWKEMEVFRIVKEGEETKVEKAVWLK